MRNSYFGELRREGNNGLGLQVQRWYIGLNEKVLKSLR